MSEKIPVSVLIIAQNEERFVKRCLDALIDFEEIVFVDGGSTDKTIEMAKSYPNVKVYENSWPGFIAQRNFSLKKASFPWCLMMDADEAATPELVHYIRDFLKQDGPKKKMYSIVRTEYYEGREVEYGIGGSGPQERFFQRDHIQYTGGVHHEHLIDGKLSSSAPSEMGHFPRELRILHNSEYTLEEMIKKFPRFSILIAHEKYARGRRTNAGIILMTFFGSFFQIFIKSFRAGRAGFILSLLEAIHRTLVKIYIYNLQHFKKEGEGKNFESKKLG